jgi:hypothetical protein
VLLVPPWLALPDQSGVWKRSGLLRVVGRRGLLRRRPCGRGPAGEHAQGVLRRRRLLRGVGEQALALLAGDREGLVREVEVADDRVVDELDAAGVDADVVGGPADPELVAARGQLPDQIRDSSVVGSPGAPGRRVSL